MSRSIRWNKYGLLAAAVVYVIIVGSLWMRKKQVLHQPTIKQILLWNEFFDYRHFEHYDIGQEQFERAGCAFTNCNITDELDGGVTTPYDDFDAVLIHGLDFPVGNIMRTAPPVRKSYQTYIFYLLESPLTYQFDFTEYKEFFNRTFTYRRDSDGYTPYGWFAEKSAPYVSIPNRTPQWLKPNYDILYPPKSMSTKVKSVAWLVSNCNSVSSKRDVYADQLSRYIDVDVYGKCGTLNCGDDCVDTINEQYKFYLAFENSLCDDYVTEKFFRSFRIDVVPIVYGGADYERFAPPMSYIDVNEYRSPRELAGYLKYLSENDDEYLKYFWWRRYYEVHDRDYQHVLCQMCAMLNDEALPRKAYDIEAWWNHPGNCRKPSKEDLRKWEEELV